MPDPDERAPEDLGLDEDARNRAVLEALLVASDKPMPAAKLASILNGAGAREVRLYVDDLNEEYLATGRSFRITEIAGGYQLTVHAEYAPWVRQLLREKVRARLSQAAIETLAIISFKQPIGKAEVEHVRGVSVDGVLRHLLEKGLIRISGRGEGVGRPLLYGTTREFLKHFGLKTLSDLPKPRELDELLRDEQAQGAPTVTQEPPFETEGGGPATAERTHTEAGPEDGQDTDNEGSAGSDLEDSREAGGTPEGGSAGRDAGADLPLDDGSRDDAPEPIPGSGGGGFQAGQRSSDPGGAGDG